MSQNKTRATASSSGECTVCHRKELTVVATTGLLWRHGPRDSPCSGSGTLPLQGSVQAGRVQWVQAPTAFDASADLFDTTSYMVDPTFSHPCSQGPTLKRIPKGSRPQASALLTRLIRDVLADVNQVRSWECLLSFALTCFASPARGGKSRNLTTVVNRQITTFDAGSVSTTRGANPPRSQRKVQTGDEAIAKLAAAKLDDGNIKGALQLLSSSDAVALPRRKPSTACWLSIHLDHQTDDHVPHLRLNLSRFFHLR